MRCLVCRHAQLTYVESRRFTRGGQVWLYKCPGCQAEFAAKQDQDMSPLPIVAQITTAEQDDTPLPGYVVRSFDLLAANPDPEGRVWKAGGPRAGEVLGIIRPEEEIRED